MTNPNSLIHETSPYLLQHAYNPVNWYAWNDTAFEKARLENKPVLISIGYSSCHWCHVMEHESFEDVATAEIMNQNFICIKVDREERPDVDSVYMHAVQMMTGRGGWPLNCFALPDGRPVYGGTYFPKQQWQHILKQLSAMFSAERSKMEEYAQELTDGLKRIELIQLESDHSPFSKNVLEKSIINWKIRLDNVEGGPQKAPKFPLPNNYVFLLRYGFMANDKELLKHVELTLDKMAMGGIYDQVGGGFARYSTDSEWKVPHFEKMLYDNAQLISLYSEAYSLFKKPLYKKTVMETIAFLNREMRNEEGFYYSALDADSDGEEGKYYVWKREEIDAAVETMQIDNPGKESLSEIIGDYFSVNEYGYWEHGNYILLRRESDDDFCRKHRLTSEQLENITVGFKQVLLETRNKRKRPGLDDKSLTSWNALTVSALCDASFFLKDDRFLHDALRTAELMMRKQKNTDGLLFHSYKNDISTIRGFLEDYCFCIEAFTRLYELTFDEKWLREAKEMMEYSLEHFVNEETGLFYFNADDNDKLIVRKSETQDNVIPASNSSMARSLFYLGKHFENSAWISHASRLLNYFTAEITNYGAGYSNWAILGLHMAWPFREIVFTGTNARKLLKEFSESYHTNLVIAGSNSISDLPLLLNRVDSHKSLIYLCENNSCRLPVEKVGDLVIA